MKVKIFPYSPKFASKFLKMKEKISRIQNIQIHHIGSTSVPGLAGKGIIDILVGAKNWKDANEVTRLLKKSGFSHIHPRQNGRIFVSKQKLTKRGDIHFHIVKTGAKQYRDFLDFRDYLRGNKKARDEYVEIKNQILKKIRGNRKKYFQLKSKYVKTVLKKIRK